MNAFLKACGALGALQLNVECQGAADVESLNFDTPFVLIGRDPLADLQLLHRDISERHAFLQLVGGRLFCVDLGSRIGTYLGGQCRRSGWVEPGQSIRVGPYRIRAARGEAADVAPPPLDDPARPRLSLELSHRALRSSSCRIHSDLALIGSAADCQVRLLDPSVSNYHACLLHTPLGHWVVDLLGQGGISVNGASVRYGQVRDGDELRLGHSVIRVRAEAAVEEETWTASLPRVSAVPTAPDLGAASVPAGGWNPSPEIQALLTDPSPEQSALIQSFVLPLANQLSVMQQEMFDQFHQAGMLMFETFATLHKEQVGILREELGRLRLLTDELGAIRNEFSAGDASERLATAPTGPPTRLGAAVLGAARGGSVVDALALARIEDGSASVALAPWIGASASRERPVAKHGLNGHAGHRPAGPNAVAGDGAGEHGPGTDPGAGRLRPARHYDANIHALLCQRIAAIQNEQQSRWRKVLNLMPGLNRKQSPA